MGFSEHCAAFGLGACALLGSVRALAQSPGAAVVEVSVAGSDEDVRALESALTEALAVSHVRARVERLGAIEPRRVSRAEPAQASSAAAGAPHLWIDRTAPGRAVLYLTSADRRRVFVRDFKLERGLDPVALELLGLVARSSVSAVLSGDSVGVSREEYERALAPLSVSPAPAPSAPVLSRRTSRSVWHFGALYELELLSASVVEQGVGAELEWQPSWLSIGLAGELYAALPVGNGPVQARLTSRTARAFVAVPFPVSEAASLAVGSAFGIDWIGVEGRDAAPGATAVPTFSVAECVVRSFASFRYRFGALELGALVGAELGLVKSHYFLLRSGEPETVFSPWRLRPLANLSLGARF